jgi:hypothetical protein
MCHEFWTRRERWRDERFDEELKHLADEERRRRERPIPVVEHDADEEPKDPDRVRVEAGVHS